MESKLKTDRRALGALILYEIVKNKDREFYYYKNRIWDDFENFSKVLGDDFMNFPDFEHFYMKLEKGECELDYDGRLKYDRNLFDLPTDIIMIIAEKLTDEEKWILCETSPSLRKLMNSYLPGCKKLEIRMNERYGSVTFKGTNYSQLEIDYSEGNTEHLGQMKLRRSVMGSKLENGGKTVEESMIRDIRQMLENPRTHLVELTIDSKLPEDNFFFKNLKPLLESQEDVQKVTISASSPSHFHSILSGLKPKTLETIELNSGERNLDLSGVVELDQMKQAKRVTLSCSNASYPLSHLMHLEDFVGQRQSLEPEDVLAIKNESIRTGNMKSFRILTAQRMSIPEINEVLGPLNPQFNDTAERRHFRIQNSEVFMKLEILGYNIVFSRTSVIVVQHIRPAPMNLFHLHQLLMDPDDFIDHLW